jgi:hypothetical protein
LEHLESRYAPAVLTVNAALDASQLTDGTLSLRDAIVAVDNGNENALTPSECNNISGALGTNDVINFALPVGSLITLGSNLPMITQNVEILGPGSGQLAISGADQYQVLSIQGPAVTIANLTISHGLAIDGGGIYLGLDSSLSINNCVLDSNSAVDMYNGPEGAAVYAAANSSMVANHCTFTNNSAYILDGDDGVGSGPCAGGAIFLGQSSAPMTVANCYFSNNFAAEGGCIYDQSTASQISNCIFSKNSAFGATHFNAGAAVFSAGMGSISGCTFNGNIVQNGSGGAIYLGGQDSVAGCTFSNNNAGGGGAVYAAAPGNTIVNCTFSDNSAYQFVPGVGVNGQFSGEGGAVYCGANLTITGSTFSENNAVSGGYSTGGGAIFCDSNFVGIYHELMLDGCTIADNSVTGGQGAGGGLDNYASFINTNAFPVLLHNTVFFDNTVDHVPSDIAGPFVYYTPALVANKFIVSASSTCTAGNVLICSITAADAQGNLVPAYNGTVHISSSDGQATLSADATLTGGVGYFGAVLRTAGKQTLTATDTANPGEAGQSGPIAVNALPASHFVIQVPPTAVSSCPVAFGIVAEDSFGNTATSYGGTVHFVSSDTTAVLPADAALASGIGSFNATFKSTGGQTLTATDTISLAVTGVSKAIPVAGLRVASLTPFANGFVAIFNKPFDASQINLYDQDGADGPSDVVLTGPGTSPAPVRGSLIIDSTGQTITFVKTTDSNPNSGQLAAGTYAVTLRSGSNGFKDSLGGALDGAANGTSAGNNYVGTFVVAPATEVVGVPSFARGPDGSKLINLPNNQSLGIPLTISAGNAVTSGTFTLQYNSALLDISGTMSNPALAGSVLSLDAASAPGKAILDFTSPTALTATGSIRLGSLLATVPNAASSSYKAKALLSFTGSVLNGGAVAVVGEDAVELVAYAGDVNGDGVLSGGDAGMMARVAVGMDTNSASGTLGGFAAYPMADPVLVGDLNGNSNVDASDVTLLNSLLAGIPRPQVPMIPVGMTLTPSGPDPTLSLPSTICTTPGGILALPVTIDTARPVGSSGAIEAILAMRYDPRQFRVSPTDIRPGTLIGEDWQMTAMVDQSTGEIGIDLFSNTPIQTNAPGTLVVINLHVYSTAPAGTTSVWLVNSVDPNGCRVFATEVADAQGAFVLHPALTANGLEPSAPSLVIVENTTPTVPWYPLKALDQAFVDIVQRSAPNVPLPGNTNLIEPVFDGLAPLIVLDNRLRAAALEDLFFSVLP